MHTPRGFSQILFSFTATFTALLPPIGVKAGPVEPRADPTTTTSSLSTSGSVSAGQPSPWISVSNGSPVATITPLITTISGTATTISAEPASTGSLSSSSTPDSKSSSTGPDTQPPTSSRTNSGVIPTPISGAFTECRNPTGPYAPFCKPTNASDVYVGDSYYVTWDPTPFPPNSTVTVLLNFVDTEGGGAKAWSSDPTNSNYGFVSVTMDNAWRHDNERNNLTFSLVELDSSASIRPKIYPGPTVQLGNKPIKHIPAPPRTSSPNKLGLLIGLPLSIGAILLIVFGLCFAMRKTRRIGLGNVMGRRKAYSSAGSKARRARLRGIVHGVGSSGNRNKNTGAIRLSSTQNPRHVVADDDDEGFDFEDAPSHFRDEPAPFTSGAPQTPRHNHRTHDSLGSLTGSPTEEGFGDDERERRGRAPGGNAFRAEVERQGRGGRAPL